MKKRALLLTLGCAFLYVSMSSYSNGYGSNRTGSHGSTVGCGSCHGSAASSTTVAIELDSAGVPVTHYVAGMTYTLKMTGTNTGTTSLPGFGAQLSMVSGTGTASVNAGTLSGAPASTGLSAGTGGITFLEHTNTIPATTGGGATGSTYVVSLTWVAPAAGTGTVTAYGLINAVNNNGNDGSTDKWNSANAAFTELTAASHVGVNNVVAADSKMYPNPVSNVLNLSGYNGVVTVFDMNGKVIATENVADTAVINTSNWASGAYFVTVNNNGAVTTKTIVK